MSDSIEEGRRFLATITWHDLTPLEVELIRRLEIALDEIQELLEAMMIRGAGSE